MRVFLDTNILLDLILQRTPFFADARAVLEACDRRGLAISAAWHGLATVFYFIAREKGEAAANEAIGGLLTWCTVATVGQKEALEALNLGIADYEDALKAAAAKACGADWLITRDAKGFAKSAVPAVSPSEFLATVGF